MRAILLAVLVLSVGGLAALPVAEAQACLKPELRECGLWGYRVYACDGSEQITEFCIWGP